MIYFWVTKTHIKIFKMFKSHNININILQIKIFRLSFFLFLWICIDFVLKILIFLLVFISSTVLWNINSVWKHCSISNRLMQHANFMHVRSYTIFMHCFGFLKFESFEKRKLLVISSLLISCVCFLWKKTPKFTQTLQCANIWYTNYNLLLKFENMTTMNEQKKMHF